jgi:hypothetical protein
VSVPGSNLPETQPLSISQKATRHQIHGVAVEWLVAADQASQHVPGIMGSLIISSFSQYKPSNIPNFGK